MHIQNVVERPSRLIDALLTVWEASVRATHDFLSEDDILSLRPIVRTALRDIPSLSILTDENGTPLGFLGIAETKIEMLFLAPEARAQGLGRRMIAHALSVFAADSVDVNEQNTQAVGFYTHLGFKAIGRSELDGQGRPFPLVHMALGNTAPPPPAGKHIPRATDE